jgi:hypothetical protein
MNSGKTTISRHRLSGFFGLGSHVLAIGLLIGACSSPESAPDRSSDAKVLVLGIDGASWKVIEPLIKDGDLPALASLIQGGATCTALDVVSPHSPIAWTSAATSRAPNDHGVDHFVHRLQNGSVIPASGSLRRVPAIWEVTSRYGVSVGVAGWWATWPADTVDGWIVSDHANPALSEFLIQDGKYWTADARALNALNRDVFPPSIAPIVASSAVTRANFDYDEYQTRAHLSPDQQSLLKADRWNARSAYSILKTFFAMDRSTVNATTALMRFSPTQLTMVYLRGPDPIQHYAWDLVEPYLYKVPPPNFDRDKGIVESVYRYIDTFVGELLSEFGTNGWVVVASDHGAEPDPRATGIPRRSRPGGHSKAATGILVIHGPGVRSGHQIQGVSPYDIMPTALWLLDVPISRELEGRVIDEAFEPSFVDQNEREYVRTYGKRETEIPSVSVTDEAMLESLRSLGYIE